MKIQAILLIRLLEKKKKKRIQGLGVSDQASKTNGSI